MNHTASLPLNNKGKAYAIFLAILPVILMYQAPGIRLSLATFLIAIMGLYAGVFCLNRISKVDTGLISCFSLYLLYAIFKSAGWNFILIIAILIHVAAITTGIANVRVFRRTIETISLIAAICVITQQVVHLVTGLHIPFIYIPWLSEEQSPYFQIISTGYGHEAMYRPSAFFLEPASFSEYVVFGLGSELFKETPRFKRATIMSLGCIATTSGIGFVLLFAVWGWWYITYKNSQKKSIKSLIIGGLLVVIVFAVLSNIPFVAKIIARFSGSESSDYNAIEGRLFNWDLLFGDTGIENLIFGFGEQSMIDFGLYVTGYMKLLYAYGIVGFSLFLLFFIYLLFHVRNFLSRMYVIMYVALLFVANITGFINIIFNVGTIIVFSQIAINKCPHQPTAKRC